MKKTILFSMAMAAILSGCSNDEPANESNYVYEPSEVEIKFGSRAEISAGVEEQSKAQKASRASVDAWNNTNVGVFVLAKNADADWTGQAARDVLWNNVSATIAADNTSTVNLNGNPMYYPNNSDREFSFFGYHPYSESGTTVASDNVKAVFNITGQEDVLWGKAEADGGYNAQYFRDNADVTPNIEFGHMLSKLQFKLKASDDFTSTTQSFKVTGIKVVNVPTELTLNVADKNPTNAGKITTGATNQELSAYNDATGIEISQGTQATDAGQPIMLYSNDQNQTYFVKLIMTSPEGNQQETSPVEVKTTEGTFKSGHAYNITLSIKSFTEVVFTASLADWKTGEDIVVEF